MESDAAPTPDKPTPDSDATETTVRVASIWRSQGEAFLEQHHDVVVADVDRLRAGMSSARGGVAVAAWQERAVDAAHAAKAKLRQWDEAAIARLVVKEPDATTEAEAPIPAEEPTEAEAHAAVQAVQQPDAVLDLTGTAPVVTVAAAIEVSEVDEHQGEPVIEKVTTFCSSHWEVPAKTHCKRCSRDFCEECLVFPRGPKRPALCVACAFVVAGIRPR
jgi:hypothetical protein